MAASDLIRNLPMLLREERFPVILYAEGVGGFASSWVVQPCIAIKEEREKIAAWLRANGFRVEECAPDDLDGWTMNIYKDGHNGQ